MLLLMKKDMHNKILFQSAMDVIRSNYHQYMEPGGIAQKKKKKIWRTCKNFFPRQIKNMPQ